ncbi:uncharacterized protein LOC128233927 [Mya arenaria]|uniref:uncharacterized protein LOC128233927 n=1 Tax=Mya arenaria TaxID=6604 RepID=UPI0022E19867|nr:uncharacterized protein LOC128233927 [Mya arenaria]
MRIYSYTFNILILSLLWTVAIVAGLICQFPHCDTVVCEPVANCTGEVKDSGGGYCGCCRACFIYLETNMTCEVQDLVEALVHPTTVVCKPGLECERNSSTCQPNPYPFG